MMLQLSNGITAKASIPQILKRWVIKKNLKRWVIMRAKTHLSNQGITTQLKRKNKFLNVINTERIVSQSNDTHVNCGSRHIRK